MAWEVLAGASLVVMGLFFLPRYLKSGVATVPQFLEQRFDHHTRTITSLIFIVAYALILLPIILYTGATGLIGHSRFLDDHRHQQSDDQPVDCRLADRHHRLAVRDLRRTADGRRLRHAQRHRPPGGGISDSLVRTLRRRVGRPLRRARTR